MKPALTAEEWELALEELREGDIEEERALLVEEYACGMAQRRSHAAAALALYGQPFGFTREDVVKLRHLLSAFHYENHVRDWLPALTDRIEDLLPPEG